MAGHGHHVITKRQKEQGEGDRRSWLQTFELEDLYHVESPVVAPACHLGMFLFLSSASDMETIEQRAIESPIHIQQSSRFHGNNVNGCWNRISISSLQVLWGRVFFPQRSISSPSIECQMLRTNSLQQYWSHSASQTKDGDTVWLQYYF